MSGAPSLPADCAFRTDAVPPAEASQPWALVVLLVSETYVPDANGAAYFLDRLAHGIADRGHEVHIACPGPAGADPRSHGRVTVHRMPSWPIPGYPQTRIGSPVRARRHLRALIDELRPDVVHVQNHFVLGRLAVAVSRRSGIPVVATNHFLPENFTSFVAWLPRVLTRAVEAVLWRGVRRVYRHAAVVTAPTSYAAALTARRAHIPAVAPISCGVDLRAFAPDGAAEAFRVRRGIPARPTLLHVGRLDPDKHVEDLIRALGLVRRRHDAQLVIVGRGRLLARLRAQARQLGLAEHVHLCGFVEDADLRGAYEAADIYCNAGAAELQSISTLEAMAAHKPVLAADAHALPLLVRDGANGYLFKPGDVVDLARLAAELLDDPARCRAMGAASGRVVAAHDLGATVGSFEALYRDTSAAPVPGPVRARPR
ncbi:MAG: glycosyltransferase, partial [Solirubrobacteraceae bacterium]